MRSAAQATRRLVVVSESWRTGDPLSDLAARVAEELGGQGPLRIARACLQNTPRPFAMPLTKAAMPDVPTIVETVLRVMEGRK